MNRIQKLKELIKNLSVAQKLLKADLRRPHSILKKEGMKVWSMQWGKQCAAIEITAALNLYNELRGKEYRHNIKPEFKYQYKKSMEWLKKMPIDEEVA